MFYYNGVDLDVGLNSVGFVLHAIGIPEHPIRFVRLAKRQSMYYKLLHYLNSC